MDRDAEIWELMVVIGRESTGYNRAGGGEVNRELVRDGRMLDIGDALRGEQARKM